MKIYTVWDSDRGIEVRGTLEELDAHFDGFCMIRSDCVEVAWDHGVEGTVYWQFTLLKTEEADDDYR